MKDIPGFKYRDGVLHADDVPVPAIVESAGTPTYIYSATAIRNAYRRLETAFAPLKVKFHGSMVMLFGESTVKSAKYRVLIDGEVVEHEVRNGNETQTLKEFDGAALASRVKGNCHHAQVIAVGLDASREHTLEIQPLFTGEDEQELRLESICVAGGAACVVGE